MTRAQMQQAVKILMDVAQDPKAGGYRVKAAAAVVAIGQSERDGGFAAGGVQFVIHEGVSPPPPAPSTYSVPIEGEVIK
ncbi:MAG: hypothetical protein HQL51_03860 [Magnetococcales bacterium]|nr:hypothetical protein [Magnetococcales bacterium]